MKFKQRKERIAITNTTNHMKKHLLLSLAFLLGWTMELWAQSGKSLDDQINEFMEPITTFVASIVFFPIPGTTIPFVLVWLIFGAIFFTFYFTFPNIRFFKLAINVVSGTKCGMITYRTCCHRDAPSIMADSRVSLGTLCKPA